LHFSALEIEAGGGPTTRITGEWALKLVTPEGLSAKLATEALRGGQAVEREAIRVVPVRAIRSRNETLVTVQLVGPAGIGHLALPRLVGSTPAVYGARIEGPTPDGLVTFSFPETAFGSSLTVDMEALIVPGGGGVSGYIDIALGDLLARQGNRGDFGSQAAVDRRDILAASPGMPDVTGVWFAGTVGTGRRVAIVLTGVYDDARAFTLTATDGTSFRLMGSGSETGTTATGAIGGRGKSYVQFEYERIEQLQGAVRLTLGEPSRVITGGWVVNFVP
jgi:hypothetical protein